MSTQLRKTDGTLLYHTELDYDTLIVLVTNERPKQKEKSFVFHEALD